jgi:Asp-tRNA(Asn)/Glu-tRNA(Gln) amidotransferase A subunit family amidase
VLAAKLSLGALAWGDVWFGGMTRNPWNPAVGSGGSSAGSASAVSAGLVPFALGSETWGSIVSPCTRCGVTGLRPTFGRVSRHGAMALSWSMDKIGPIARSAEDCRIVFRHLHGADPQDRSAVTRPFDETRAPERLTGLRIGYVPNAFERDRTADVDDETLKPVLASWAEADRRALTVLEGLGATLMPVSLPDRIAVPPLALILTAEASTAFDDLTRSGQDDGLTRQVEVAWPNVFRQGQLIPAVEYLRANRIRTLLMEDWDRLFETIDVLVTPSFHGDVLLATNLTGHPQVVVPVGVAGGGWPLSLSFVGRMWAEGDLLAVAEAYQLATDHHRARPDLDAVLAFREES